MDLPIRKHPERYYFVTIGTVDKKPILSTAARTNGPEDEKTGVWRELAPAIFLKLTPKGTYEKVMPNGESYHEVRKYNDENPLKWDLDHHSEDRGCES